MAAGGYFPTQGSLGVLANLAAMLAPTNSVETPEFPDTVNGEKMAGWTFHKMDPITVAAGASGTLQKNGANFRWGVTGASSPDSFIFALSLMSNHQAGGFAWQIYGMEAELNSAFPSVTPPELIAEQLAQAGVSLLAGPVSKAIEFLVTAPSVTYEGEFSVFFAIYTPRPQ